MDLELTREIGVRSSEHLPSPYTEWGGGEVPILLFLGSVVRIPTVIDFNQGTFTTKTASAVNLRKASLEYSRKQLRGCLFGRALCS
ncbi:hypothetical protein TNCT_41111 [Trichonephila clavata]|uniref:Uncharacterized protein n=1 Tax=Trichonephila clavata TaxID=2740835 RepID=A0A8X6IY88_TRICU|nr:hypothetical protein TNCT_41111 [Trichonephila clavata]